MFSKWTTALANSHVSSRWRESYFQLANSKIAVCAEKNLLPGVLISLSEAELGFVMLAYTVNEEDDDKVEICVDVKSPDTIECPVVYPLEFIVTVNDITASMYKQQ